MNPRILIATPVKDAASQGSKVIAQHLQMAQQLAKDQNLAAAGQ